MSKQTIVRILAFALVAASAASLRLAAQDAPSVAEAARRARQQKQEASKPAKIITNDSIPAPQPAAGTNDSAAPMAPADSNVPAANDGIASSEQKKAESPEDDARKKQEIEALRKLIAAKQDEVTTQQGLLALDQNTYYSNPDYVHDTAGQAKIDGEKADLDRMQQEMADLKAKLEGLGVNIPAKPPAKKESITQNAPPPEQ